MDIKRSDSEREKKKGEVEFGGIHLGSVVKAENCVLLHAADPTACIPVLGSNYKQQGVGALVREVVPLKGTRSMYLQMSNREDKNKFVSFLDFNC